MFHTSGGRRACRFPLWESALTLGVSLLVSMIAESLLIVLSLVIGAAGLLAYALIDPEFAWPGVPLVIAVIVLLAIGGALAVVWCVFLGTWPPQPDSKKISARHRMAGA